MRTATFSRTTVPGVRARQSGVWDQRSPRVELAPPSYDFEPTVRRVLRHIGVEEADTVPVPEPVWRPLSGPERDLWAKRFRDEIEQS